MNELKAGESILVKITKNVSYTITNTGWAIEINSTQPLKLIPKSPFTVGIGCSGASLLSDEDDV